jgi:hypothetical protein
MKLKEILEYNGKVELDLLLKTYKRPFLLKEKEESESEISIPEIAEIFTAKLMEQHCSYFKIWKLFISNPYEYYSKSFREVSLFLINLCVGNLF